LFLNQIKKNQFSDVLRLVQNGAHTQVKSGLLIGGPLHQLAQTTSAGELPARFRRRVADLLLSAGLDANVIDAAGRTALMIVARRGLIDLQQLLLLWVCLMLLYLKGFLFLF
jgi:ankyrin repeat protein